MQYSNGTIYIFGAIILDLIVKKDKFIPNTSNISKIDMSLGGVGYNIFRGISYPNKKMVTMLGEDFVNDYILKNMNPENVIYKTIPNIPNSKYIAFMESGELLLSTTGLEEPVDFFDEYFIDHCLEHLTNKDMVIIDSNLQPDILKHIIDKCSWAGARVVFETVCVEKAQRSKDVVRDAFLITPTIEELEAITAYNCDNDVLDFMHRRNIENTVLTLGKQGIKWFRGGDKNSIESIQPHRVLNVDNTNGAGDKLLATLIDNLYRGQEIEKAIDYALYAVEELLMSRVKK
ncbi:MAG: PfkB family carbohydrate kinase [Pseudomonadota bacterium]